MLDWLVPPLCVACRRVSAASGDPLCDACRATLPWLGPGVCDRCALPRPCGRCPSRAFAAAWSPLAYAGPVPAIVVALKDHGALRLARLMAAQMAATAPPGLWAAAGMTRPARAAPPAGAAAPIAVALVPVPADPLRRRRRGVDHAARLARELAPRTGLPVAAVLARAGSSPRHAQLSRAERLRADPAGVGVRTGAERDGRVPEAAILVDDVHTTGATLHACALALKASGTRRVVAVTYARTLTE
jgi:predicted amidophosphoribosyltransferase